jgi:hypothetical protein
MPGTALAMQQDVRTVLAGCVAALAVSLVVPAHAQSRPGPFERSRAERSRLWSSSAWILTPAEAELVLSRSGRAPVEPALSSLRDLPRRDCSDCAERPLNQVFAFADRFVQRVPALEFVGSLLLGASPLWSRVKPSAALRNGLDFRLVPVRYSGGYGLTAVGRF